MLLIPRNVLVDEKEAFFQRTCVAILIHTKKDTLIFVKENLSNSGPVVTTIANVFCLSLDVPQGEIDCNHTPLIILLRQWTNMDFKINLKFC